MLRSFTPDDVTYAKEIWQRYYANEFQFPDFTNMLFSGVVEDKDGRIISIGAIELIPEAIMVTDKSFNARRRWDAIAELLDVGIHVAQKHNFVHLHATVQDDKWKENLEKLQFNPIKGEFLVRQI